MLQRIQTLYLLLSVILMGVCLGMLFTRVLESYEYYVIGGLCGLFVLVGLWTIFDFKNRKRQMRSCVRLMLLAILAAAALYRVPVLIAFPAVSLVSVLLARRGIKRDEDLVRAADRIR